MTIKALIRNISLIIALNALVACSESEHYPKQYLGFKHTYREFTFPKTEDTHDIIVTVIATEKATFNIIFMAMERFSATVSFAPYFCAVITANPAVNPVTKPSTRKFIGPVVPTAARAAVPNSLPTIIVSAMLYNCCTKLPISNGIE